MIIAGKRIALPFLPLRAPLAANDCRRATAHEQLNRTFRASPQVPFDDTSRFVFFSDCHRGTNGRTDAFAPNQELFRQVLGHYLKRDFTYVEVGDGDELWMNPRFSDVQRAHRPIFDLLHQFDRLGRLHLLVGNHDVPGRRNGHMNKGGLSLGDGLVLQHTKTGQQILVAHGHQADFGNDPDFTLSRFMVRHFWRRLQQLGFGNVPMWAKTEHTRSWLEQFIMDRLQAHKRKIEQRIVTWLQEFQQTVICGHTHLAHFAARGTPPYFNAGSCVIPGQITGLEIEGGRIALVRYSSPERTLLAPPRKLSLLY
jgi:UDP-2,3-diacylglucosamine pyrophosphatase LpxH